MLTRRKSFEEAIIEYCSPTLVGIKVGNLFTYEFSSKDDIRAIVQKCTNLFLKKGIRIKILKKFPHKLSFLFLVYRQESLKNVLQDFKIQTFLQARAYRNPSNLQKTMEDLSRAVRTSALFPHEIGIFLGYPLEDVQGFIRHQGRNALCCGCWKVYGDQKRAEQCFLKYKQCTEILLNRHKAGEPIERLIVAA